MMTHRDRRHLRAALAVLGIVALIVAIVAATTAKIGAQHPTQERPTLPFSEELADHDGTVVTTETHGDTTTITQMTGPQKSEKLGVTRFNERTGYPDLEEYSETFPWFTRRTEISFPDTKDHYQALKDAWEMRDPTAGFQADYFVWYAYTVTTNATVRFEGVNPPGMVNCGKTTLRRTRSNETFGLISADDFFRKFLFSSRDWAEEKIQIAVSDIATVCGPYRVVRWEHHFTVHTIPQDQVYYGDTPMFHPETGEIVSFLDWLWETTDTYEEMIETLGVIGTRGANNNSQYFAQSTRAADGAAYAFAAFLLEGSED